MSKLPAEPMHLSIAEDAIRARAALAHLRVRKRGDTLIFESGPVDDPIRHFRLRRVTRQWWTPEVQGHSSRWDPLPIRAGIPDALDSMLREFPWLVHPLE